MSVTINKFGKTQDGRTVHSFSLYQGNGSFCTLLTYGGALQRLLMPDRYGNFQDIVLGYEDMSGYESARNPYHGALIGRHGNRIEDACFELDGQTCLLARNNGRNHLHGGIRGFDKQIWEGEPVSLPEGPAVCFRYLSPDGEEGYPGSLDVQVTYVLKADYTLVIRYLAVAGKKTVINLTNHCYFNLAGQGSGTILNHQLQIEADEFTVINDECIPTGEIAPVAGTALDFRQMKPIGRDINSAEPMIVAGLGYDHNFILRDKSAGLKPCATVYEPKFGRVMAVETTLPGVQLYTGNFMKTDTGKEGVRYDYRNGFCLETQYFPNALKHKHFPSPVFTAGEPYRHETLYRFSAR